jgi:hypothetical protein
VGRSPEANGYSEHGAATLGSELAADSLGEFNRPGFVGIGLELDLVIDIGQLVATENLSGSWSYRTLSAKKYEVEYGQPFDGRFVLVIAMENKPDADKLYTHFAEPAGSA